MTGAVNISGPMERVQGPIAFVVLNQIEADRLEAALHLEGWADSKDLAEGREPLAKADIIVVDSQKCKLSDMSGDLFKNYKGLVFIMASGIVLRVIAPHINNKYYDPAVVILDDQWRHAVSALSGHEGGANWLTYQCARLTGARPVISTGTETNKKITLGIGCRRGTSVEQITGALDLFLTEQNVKVKDIRAAATLDLKRNEKGLTLAMDQRGIPLLFFSKEEINQFDGNFTPSEVAQRRLGVKGVSEPCALMAGRCSKLIGKKTIMGPITLALAKEE